MTLKQEKIINKLTLIDILFKNNLNYVNVLSEFLANSLDSNWNKFIETGNKNKYIDKIKKNIDKVEKIEIKQSNERFLQEVLVSNLLLINKSLKKGDVRYCKKIMRELQCLKSLGQILNYLLNEYTIFLNMIDVRKNNETTKLKNDLIIQNGHMKEEKIISYSVVTSLDRNNNYFVHIKITNNKMVFDEKSFELENDNYKNALINNNDNPFVTDSKLNYSSFEKKRRIYVKCMYDLDRRIYNLTSKKVDITYPIDKVFNCAREVVDCIYRELINYSSENSTLGVLMNYTINTYGGISKIDLYSKLYTYLKESIENVDVITKQEIIDSSKYMIVEKGYVEFRNIESFLPSIDDVYKAVNDKIMIYLCQNIHTIFNKINLIDGYTRFMNIMDLAKLYTNLKSIMIRERLSSKYFIDLQKCLVNIIKDRFNKVESEIFNSILKDEKLY